MLVFKSCVKKYLLVHVLLRVSLESRGFSKVCLLLKLVFMVMGLIFLLLKFFLLIDLILGPLHSFSEERFKVLLIVLKLGGWMDFSRLSKPKGMVRDSGRVRHKYCLNVIALGEFLLSQLHEYFSPSNKN